MTKKVTLLMLLLLVQNAQTLASSVIDDASGRVVIAVEGARALREALYLLQQQLGCTISYEDPKYESADAVKALYNGGPVVPKHHNLTFTYMMNQRSDKRKIIEALVTAYESEDKTARFDVAISLVSENVYNVIPVESCNKSGMLEKEKAITNTSVSLNVAGTYAANIEQLCQSVSHVSPNPHIGYGDLPQGFYSASTTLKYKNQSFRECLNKLLSIYRLQTHQNLSWSLARDPVVKMAALNLRPLPEPPPPAAQIANTLTMYIATDRPLTQAVSLLGKQYHVTTIYEDAPWACDCEVMKDATGKPQALRGGIFGFSGSLMENPAQVVQDCVKAYNGQSNPGQFAAKQVEQAFSISPVQSMNADGSPNIITKPILSNEISFSVAKAPLTEIVQQLCHSLTAASGKTVSVGTLPDDLASARSLSYMANTKAVSVCLAEITKHLGVNLSWQLLYDPRTGQYTLNVAKAEEGEDARPQ